MFIWVRKSRTLTLPSIQGNSGRESSRGTLDLDQFKVQQILNDFRNDLRGMIDIDESPCKSVTRLLLL